MSNIRFAWNNLYAAAATLLTASTSAAAMPVTATKNPDRNYLWRSASAVGTQTIDIDLGSVQNASCVALANVTVLGAGIVELYHRGDAGAPGAAVLVANLPAQDAVRKTAIAFFATLAHRHWQLKWTNPGAVNTYAELGYGFLGTYDEPTVNVRVPIARSRVDPSRVSESSDGQKSVAGRAKFDVGVWVFDAVQEAQRSQVSTMFEAIGIASPFFVTLDTALAWSTWLARITNGLDGEIEPQQAIGRHSVQIPWEEVR